MKNAKDAKILKFVKTVVLGVQSLVNIYGFMILKIMSQSRIIGANIDFKGNPGEIQDFSFHLYKMS